LHTVKLLQLQLDVLHTSCHIHHILNSVSNIHVSVKQIRWHEHYQTRVRKRMNMGVAGLSQLPAASHLPCTLPSVGTSHSPNTQSLLLQSTC
jgi:hypothetical protein